VEGIYRGGDARRKPLVPITRETTLLVAKAERREGLARHYRWEVLSPFHEPQGKVGCLQPGLPRRGEDTAAYLLAGFRPPWESGAKGARTPDASRLPGVSEPREAFGVRPIYRRFLSGARQPTVHDPNARSQGRGGSLSVSRGWYGAPTLGGWCSCRSPIQPNFGCSPKTDNGKSTRPYKNTVRKSYRKFRHTPMPQTQEPFYAGRNENSNTTG